MFTAFKHGTRFQVDPIAGVRAPTEVVAQTRRHKMMVVSALHRILHAAHATG